ncbi:MAG: hypothetical protein VZQ98_05985 [Bacteroidales bacterium]|nr:hypothetical protein [Bacteroidales bacterium]
MALSLKDQELGGAVADGQRFFMHGCIFCKLPLTATGLATIPVSDGLYLVRLAFRTGHVD